MTPIDDELRNLLHARADVLAPSPDPLGGIERRARRIRRNRVAASVAGAALAVSAVAVAVPLLRPDGGTGSSQVATRPPSPNPSSTSQPAALDPQHPWDYRGAPAVIAGNELPTLRAEWTTKHPGATLTPLFGHFYGPSRQPEIVFVSTGEEDRWGVATSSESGWSFLHDEALAPGTTALLALLPGDATARLLVVAAPSTGVIQYAPDGQRFRPILLWISWADLGVEAPSPGTVGEASEAGLGMTALEGDTSKAVVRILDGDGDLDHPVFLGPIPAGSVSGDGSSPAPSPSPDASQPAEVTSAPTMAARLAFDPAHPWAYRGAVADGTGDIISADNKQFMGTHAQSAGEQDTVLYAVHLSATTDVAVVLHAKTEGDWVSFTAHDGNGTHQVAYQPASGEDILSAYLPLDAQHGLLIGVVSDQAANVVLQTGDRAEVGGSRTAGIWDWTPKADPQARLAAFAKGDGEPYSSQPAT